MSVAGKEADVRGKLLKVGMKEQERLGEDGNLKTFGIWAKLKPFGADCLRRP